MKKILSKLIWIPSLVVLALMLNSTVTFAEQNDLDLAKEAGFTEEQYQEILDMPDFPDDVERIQDSGIAPFSASQQDAVVNKALSYLGVPYVWGGTSPSGFDCSGLVQYVYKNATGINLPRVTNQQEKQGTEVSLNALQKGDLLFFGTRGNTHHVAIYIGNNQFVHSPKPGDVVKITNMQYYYPNFARRILKNDSGGGTSPAPDGNIPLGGDWDGDGKDSIALKMGARYHIRNSLTSGQADFGFDYGSNENIPLSGDWDGDGIDTIAVKIGSDYHIKNSWVGGFADFKFGYGPASATAIAGDWDGDGKDSIAVKIGNVYHIRNSLTGGYADYAFTFGSATDIPIAGDWDGDGIDTIAVKSGATYSIRNSLTTGGADVTFVYGEASSVPIAGDWNGDGKDTITLKMGNMYHVKNSLAGGFADFAFMYG